MPSKLSKSEAAQPLSGHASQPQYLRRPLNMAQRGLVEWPGEYGVVTEQEQWTRLK